MAKHVRSTPHGRPSAPRSGTIARSRGGSNDLGSARRSPSPVRDGDTRCVYRRLERRVAAASVVPGAWARKRQHTVLHQGWEPGEHGRWRGGSIAQRVADEPGDAVRLNAAVHHCIQWSPVERRRDGDGDLRLRTRSVSGQYARVSATCRNRPTRRQSWVQVVGRFLMIGVLLLAACDDGQSTSSPTTGPETTAIHATTVAAASPTCQGPLTLQQVSTASAKVIGTSPVFAAGMDSAQICRSRALPRLPRECAIVNRGGPANSPECVSTR